MRSDQGYVFIYRAASSGLDEYGQIELDAQLGFEWAIEERKARRMATLVEWGGEIG